MMESSGESPAQPEVGGSDFMADPSPRTTDVSDLRISYAPGTARSPYQSPQGPRGSMSAA